MGETFLLIRVVAAGALVGFLVFCVANVVVVWRKRNAKKGGPAPAHPAGRRLAWCCLLTGVLLVPVSALQRAFTRGEGTLVGEGLYILRAQDDLSVELLRDSGPTGAGEVLARFGSRTARPDELRARVERAEAESRVLELLPLSPDPELTRRSQAVAQERAQARQELGQAVIALEVAGRDLTAQLFTRKESLARFEVTLTERRKDLDRAALKSKHARQQWTRFQSPAASGSVSASESQDLLKASRDADIELSSLTQEVKDLQAEKEETRRHLDKLEAERADSSAPLRTQVAALTDRVARLDTDAAEWTAKLELDLARCAKLRSAEQAQAAAKVREHQAAVDGLTREREVVAPFAGTLAYRATSPNAVRARETLAVLAPADGLRLTARLAEADADAIRDGAEVTVELGDDSTQRRLPARFHKSEPLAHEPGFATVQLACQPPPELVRRLADGEKLTAAFAWHPPLVAMWPFRAGVVLFAGGMIGLFLIGLAVAKRSEPTVETVVADPSPAVATAVVGQPLGARSAAGAKRLPDAPSHGGVVFAEPVGELDRAADASGVAGLLDRLCRISSLHGPGQPASAPERHVRRTPAEFSGRDVKQPSGRH